MSTPNADPIVLAVIGDIHGELYHFKKVLDHLALSKLSGMPLAGVLLVGDFGSPEFEVQRFRSSLGKPLLRKETARILELAGALDVELAWVPGNHDHPDLDLPGNCDRRLASVGGLRVFGIGGAGPGRFGFPYEWDESEIRALSVPPCDVILCHAPPARTRLDLLFHAERHVGSEAIRELAERHRGALVCGHIHESNGLERLGDCLCLNAGSLGDPYGSIQLGFVAFNRSRGEVVEVAHENLLTGKREVVEI